MSEDSTATLNPSTSLKQPALAIFTGTPSPPLATDDEGSDDQFSAGDTPTRVSGYLEERKVGLTGELDEKKGMPVEIDDEGPIKPQYPDGGYGWVVVVACFFMQFIFFGIPHIWGVFQETYLHREFPGEINSTALSIVGSLQPGVRNLFSIISGILCSRFGFRPMLLSGTLIASTGLILASFVTNPWLLLPTHGIMLGLGGGMVYVPILSAPSHWFMKKRALVAGIGIAGAGTGGLAMASGVTELLQIIGFRWTLRLLATCLLVIGGVSSFLIRSRLPIQRQSLFTAKTGQIAGSGRFFFLSSTIAIFNLINYVPMYLIPSYALTIGLSKEQGAMALGLLNATQAAGRILAGVIGDKVGRVNALMVTLLLSSIFCLGLWLPATTFAILLAFSGTFGLVSGGVPTLGVAVIPEIFGIERTAAVTGMVMGVSGIPILVGSPLAVIIRDQVGYEAAKLFCGIALLGAMILSIGLRWRLSAQMWKKI